ncbi:MAG: hypothetical protein CMH61_00915 [Nanoarchaeota archaeon]|nr:hypothetical protein [Nanoarchaeota archaeon]
MLIVGRRENSWKGLRLLQKLTGINVITGRYPPGILTNSQLTTFIEPKVLLVTDPWPDKNAVADARRIGIPVVALCDTNNQSNDIDLVVPCNNKGKKSIGMFFYLISREYLAKRGNKDFDNKPQDFMDE